MIHVYYHIYAIDGVEEIIEEQISLIKKYFDFPYTLNVGISIAKNNLSTTEIINRFEKIRDVRCGGNEFTTLDLIEKDKQNFGDSDYILYIHTKGASKQTDVNFNNIISWRHLMNYFNIEKVKDVFKLFERTDFNTHGVLYGKSSSWIIYSGNFWWAKSDYVKTIKFDSIKKSNRYQAEWNFISTGDDWKPYSPYNVEEKNHYKIYFKKEEYAK